MVYPVTVTGGGATPSGTPLCNLDITYLQQMAQTYYDNAIVDNTKSTYSMGQKRFVSFCESTKLKPMPVSESTLLLFVAHLTSTNIFHATIKVYLSAIHYMHVTAGCMVLLANN